LEILERHRIGCEAAAQACGVPLADKSYVFSPDVDCSTPYNPETLTALFGRCRDKIGHPDLRLHHLRHFSATQQRDSRAAEAIAAGVVDSAHGQALHRCGARGRPTGSSAQRPPPECSGAVRAVILRRVWPRTGLARSWSGFVE
jgi:hypothetical protein